jgi:DNA repair exonuclease SbcCD ATPase subunit
MTKIYFWNDKKSRLGNRKPQIGFGERIPQNLLDKISLDDFIKEGKIIVKDSEQIELENIQNNKIEKAHAELIEVYSDLQKRYEELLKKNSNLEKDSVNYESELTELSSKLNESEEKNLELEMKIEQTEQKCSVFQDQFSGFKERLLNMKGKKDLEELQSELKDSEVKDESA